MRMISERQMLFVNIYDLTITSSQIVQEKIALNALTRNKTCQLFTCLKE